VAGAGPAGPAGPAGVRTIHSTGTRHHGKNGGSELCHVAWFGNARTDTGDAVTDVVSLLTIG